MRFRESLESGRFPVALEITPPRKPAPAILRRRADLLGPAAAAINVIQRTGRQSSLDASIALAAAGYQSVWHMVTRGRSRADIAADLALAGSAGIETLLCIRGDSGVEDHPDTPTIRETVALACEAIPAGLIGATLNQYGPAEAVLRNLLPKLHAGANYIQTQPVFEPSSLTSMAEAVKQRAPGTHIVAMAMPLVSLTAVSGIEARLGVSVDDRTTRALRAGPEAGWVLFAETLAELAAHPLIDGVAIMTFETDPSPEAGERIREALRRAGLSA